MHKHDGGHSHASAGVNNDNERRVFWALLLTGGFLIGELVGGIIAGSLALIADAGHMLTDTAALGLWLYAFRVSRRPFTANRSYGHSRFQVLAALINGSTLLAIAVWITIEAAQRLFAPVEVLGGIMFVIAAIGLAINIIGFVILNGGEQQNLNVRGAALHVLGDLLGSAAALAAACIILLTGWTPIDPILSVLVALLIVRSAWALVSRSWHVLMEGTPEGLDVEALKRDLVAVVPGLLDIHHVHAWSLTPERTLMTMHARIGKSTGHEAVLHRLQHELARRFGIKHGTIQIERERCSDELAGLDGRGRADQ